MNLTAERLYPAILGVIALVAAWAADGALPGAEGYRAGLLSASISASAIFVGFVATSKSILMALPKDGIRRRIHQSGYMEELASYLNQAMSSNLAFCVLNITGFFPVVQAGSWFLPLWCGLGMFSITAFWRIGRVMMAVLRADIAEEQDH
jgi:hypothetical protein